MKLNPDCMRAVLFYIEENQHMKSDRIQQLLSSQIASALENKFSREDVYYSVKQLCDSYYLSGKPHSTIDASYLVMDITPRGHDFIENVRNEEIWNETKQRANKIGNFSLGVISEIAVNVISSLITSQFTQ